MNDVNVSVEERGIQAVGGLNLRTRSVFKTVTVDYELQLDDSKKPVHVVQVRPWYPVAGEHTGDTTRTRKLCKQFDRVYARFADRSVFESLDWLVRRFPSLQWDRFVRDISESFVTRRNQLRFGFLMPRYTVVVGGVVVSESLLTFLPSKVFLDEESGKHFAVVQSLFLESGETGSWDDVLSAKAKELSTLDLDGWLRLEHEKDVVKLNERVVKLVEQESKDIRVPMGIAVELSAMRLKRQIAQLRGLLGDVCRCDHDRLGHNINYCVCKHAVSVHESKKPYEHGEALKCKACPCTAFVLKGKACEKGYCGCMLFLERLSDEQLALRVDIVKVLDGLLNGDVERVIDGNRDAGRIAEQDSTANGTSGDAGD